MTKQEEMNRKLGILIGNTIERHLDNKAIAGFNAMQSEVERGNLLDQEKMFRVFEEAWNGN